MGAHSSAQPEGGPLDWRKVPVSQMVRQPNSRPAPGLRIPSPGAQVVSNRMPQDRKTAVTRMRGHYGDLWPARARVFQWTQPGGPGSSAPIRDCSKRSNGPVEVPKLDRSRQGLHKDVYDRTRLYRGQ